MSPRKMMIVAGEASADLHGARLLRALRRRIPDLACFGIGGPSLEKAGAEILFKAADLAVVGITEAAAKAPTLLRALSSTRRELAQRRPHLLVLIDFPDFNLMLARTAKRLGIPVLYYISPQVWAWRPGRIRTIAARVDHMAVILPFEEALYRRHGVPVTFVGHPLMDAAPPPACGPLTGPIRVGLLPGSRDSEVQRHLPVMLAAVERLRPRYPDAVWRVSVAPTVDPALVTGILTRHGLPGGHETIIGSTADLLATSTVVVAASGTVTLEAAIAGTPTVIVYKVSPLSYRLGRLLIQVPYIGLANLIAGAPLMPELIQDDANPNAIARSIAALLDDPARRERMRAALAEVRRRLGPPGATERLATIAHHMMGLHSRLPARRSS